MTTTPEQIDVWHRKFARYLLFWANFLLRDNPVKTSLEAIIQIKSKCCLFKRLPLSTCFSRKRGVHD
jgi:hypothetical protein